MKLSSIIQIVKPEYTFLRLKPNNSIRNNSTHKIARTIANLYRNVTENVKKEEATVKKLFGRSIIIPTKLSYQQPSKIAYLIYIEKKKVEFYFILPKHHASLLQERMSDSWSNITIEEVDTLPEFGKDATKYQLSYAKEDALSLKIDRRDSELLHSTLNVIDVLEEGDRVGVLYNFIPTSQFSWRAQYRNTITKVKNNVPVDRDKLGTSYLLKRGLGLLVHIVDLVSETLAGSKKETADDKTGWFESILERMSGGRKIGDSTNRKASAMVVDTQILVMSESKDELRQRNNARSMTQSFDTVSDDNQLRARTYRYNIQYKDFWIRGAAVNKCGDEEIQNFIALPGRETLERFNVIERVETQETQVPEDLQSGVMRIGTNTYRGVEQMAFLSNDDEFKYLTLVLIGPTRAGKSTLIGNLGADAVKAGECFILFDFIKNCELSSEIAALFPKDKVLNIECGDFKKLEGLGYNEIGRSLDPLQQYDNTKRSSTQLQTLVNAIVTTGEPLTPKMKRFLQSAAHVAFISGGSIRDVFQILQDHEVRHAFIKRIPEAHKANLSKYVQSLSELDDYETDKKTKRDVLVGTKFSKIDGIIDRMNELEQNTYLEMMLNKDTAGNIDLVKEMQKNQLICIRMPERAYPTDAERDVICTYWMTKLWLALQIRGFQIQDRAQLTKVNFVFDELYQVRTTEKLLTEKLSRLAKFGAKPIISCHYLNQISGIRNELRSANASYMLISGCDKKNYDELKSELYPFQEEDLLNLPRYHSLNLIKDTDRYARFITRLPKPVGKS